VACDPVPLSERFPTFRKIAVPSTVKQTKMTPEAEGTTIPLTQRRSVTWQKTELSVAALWEPQSVVDSTVTGGKDMVLLTHWTAVYIQSSVVYVKCVSGTCQGQLQEYQHKYFTTAKYLANRQQLRCHFLQLRCHFLQLRCHFLQMSRTNV